LRAPNVRWDTAKKVFLEVAGRAVRRRIVLAVAVHTLTHLQRFYLGNLCLRLDVPMAC